MKGGERDGKEHSTCRSPEMEPGPCVVLKLSVIRHTTAPRKPRSVLGVSAAA